MTAYRFFSRALFPLLFIALLYSGCGKNEDADAYDVWLPQPLKSAFLFQPGSYWIMYDESGSTVLYDTITVTAVIHDTADIINPGSQLAFAQKERFRVMCYSSYYKRTFHFLTQSADLCGSLSYQEPCYFIALEIYANDAVQSSSRIYYYPDEADNGWRTSSQGMDNSVVRIEEVLPSYQLDNATYTSVRRVLTQKDRTSQNSDSYRYFAPGTGLIRWTIPAKNVDWKLFSASVVQ